ncbi:MAG: hypothetical protein AB6733_09560 [Clostridiaceae bacterium]
MKNFLNKNYYLNIYIFSLIIGIALMILINTQPFSDFQYYYNLASQIGDNQSFGNTYTSIGYSIILGYIFKITGSSIIIAKLFNLVLYSILGILAYLIIKNIPLPERKRRIFYSLYMLFPTNLIYLNLLGSEILFTLILMVLVYIYMIKEFKYKNITVGLIVGLGTIIKPFFIIFPFVILVYRMIIKEPLKKSIVDLIITLIVLCTVVSPLIIRNTLYNNKLTFVSNNGGIVLYINNNSENTLGRWMRAEDVADSVVLKEEYINADMTEKNKMLSTAAKQWIKSHPIDFLELGTKRILNTYLAPDDIFYIFNGTKFQIQFTSISDYFGYIKNNFSVYTMVNLILVFVTAIFKIVVFLPALIYMVYLTIKNLINIIKGKKVDSTLILFLGTFYMFTIIYFVTEGQGRYAFPLNFIFIYYFVNLFFKDNRQ